MLQNTERMLSSCQIRVGLEKVMTANSKMNVPFESHINDEAPSFNAFLERVDKASDGLSSCNIYHDTQ